MPCPKEVLELVDRFNRNREAYISGGYNEEQLRNEFINPFFIALGWDVYNEQGYAEAYKDVIHEEAIKIGGATKAPDYCFRIGGTRKFFLEAKRPSVKIKEDADSAFQLRRYAWSANLPLSILTNFEEFAVYDCRIKPHKDDKASTGRILYINFQEFPARWDEIYSIFARDAVLKGSFDKYAESTKRKKGTAEVDDAFLKEIERWRENLARNIALRNTNLTQRELNFAVQMTIDRMIFLRICEDRGIEKYGRLMSLLNGEKVYQRLFELFRLADERYNSGLFHFRAEKERASKPDELTPGLAIDDKALKEIIRDIYYPESPYEFSVLPADILGQVYEQFLGKVIRLTAGHHAVVEDKPEVKKAGGVYYTPTYIVDYIVQNTVGKLLEGKNPKSAEKIKILDPACGSGSFLLGAYQKLLDWHRDWYEKDGAQKYTKGRFPKLFQSQGGQWRLTTSERKRILLNSMYGVDIDPQAVEVTKLSLLLKVLEGENQQTIDRQLRIYHERALPDLSDNIKCGNSLIGNDFYDGKQKGLSFDEEERYRINAFDWQKEFPEIFNRRNPGFDAVIGNPPWISAWTSEEGIRSYIAQKIPTLEGHWDLYLAFLVKTFGLLNSSGVHSFIYPTSILSEPYAKRVRKMLVDKKHILALSLFGTERVFIRVSRKACILVLTAKSSAGKAEILHWETGSPVRAVKIDPSVWATSHNHIFYVDATEEDSRIKEKIERKSARVGNVYYVNYGAQICSKAKGQFSRDKFLSNQPRGNSKKFLDGSSIKRYETRWKGLYLDYQPTVMYGPRHPKFFECPKIIVNKTSRRGYGLSATYDDSAFYCDQRLICLLRYDYLGGIPLRLRFSGFERISARDSEIYHTALLNSRLLRYYFSKFTATKNLQGDYTDVVPKMVRSLPLRIINFSNPADKSRHDKMVELVELMLDLHKRISAAKTEHEKDVLQRQIDATDKQIDNLVYELYNLTEDEIKIVEGAAR